LRPVPGKARGLFPVHLWRGVPILGRVVAGAPLLAEENVEGTIDLTEEFRGEKVFALKVRGDSMKDAGICEDDLVVVRAQEQAEPGQIVVAQVDGETTVKRLARRQGKLELQPANDRYAPIPVTATTRILGKVIGVIRSYERKL
jgi:repressor LexA